MKKYLFILILISIFSCSKESKAGSGFAGKTYVYRLFENEQECIDAQPDPDFFLNCHRELNFIDDENAEIMFTDITMAVKYTIDANRITINFSTDESSSLIFEIIDNSSLKLLNDDIIWSKKIGDSIWN